MSGEFDSRKDSHSIKLERRPQIFVKLSFRQLHLFQPPSSLKREVYNGASIHGKWHHDAHLGWNIGF